MNFGKGRKTMSELLKLLLLIGLEEGLVIMTGG